MWTERQTEAVRESARPRRGDPQEARSQQTGGTQDVRDGGPGTKPGSGPSPEGRSRIPGHCHLGRGDRIVGIPCCLCTLLVSLGFILQACFLDEAGRGFCEARDLQPPALPGVRERGSPPPPVLASTKILLPTISCPCGDPRGDLPRAGAQTLKSNAPRGAEAETNGGLSMQSPHIPCARVEL